MQAKSFGWMVDHYEGLYGLETGGLCYFFYPRRKCSWNYADSFTWKMKPTVQNFILILPVVSWM